MNDELDSPNGTVCIEVTDDYKWLAEYKRMLDLATITYYEKVCDGMLTKLKLKGRKESEG